MTQSDRLLRFFDVHRQRDEIPVDVWPSGLAPFIRLAEPGSGNPLALEDGRFGLVPPQRGEMARGKRGFHNARSETVAQLPSFRQAWRDGLRCIIPAEHIYEPFYAEANAKSERWRISRNDSHAMGIAGIYRWSTFDDGTQGWTFAMLTVNADDHPVMSRFHAWGEEKRMVVILDELDYGPWLQCPVTEAPRFFRQWQGALVTEAAPLAPGRRFKPTVEQEPAAQTAQMKKAQAKKAAKPPKPAPPENGELF